MVYENQTHLMQLEYGKKALDQAVEGIIHQNDIPKGSMRSQSTIENEEYTVLDRAAAEQKKLQTTLKKLNLLKNAEKMRVVESDWLKDLFYQKPECEFRKQHDIFMKMQKFTDPILRYGFLPTYSANLYARDFVNSLSTLSLNQAEKLLQRKEEEVIRASPKKILNFILNNRFLTLPSI